MNAQRKKAAVTKYIPVANGGKTLEEIKLEIAADDKNYTEEEMNEIMAELGDRSSAPDPAKDVHKKSGSKKSSKASAEGHYEEWDVQISNNKAEKLKLSRACVKITEEEAGTLNAGVLQGGNTYAKMYYKA